ncbi:hypothetical protein EMIHUDRAFT_448873, partial [Emiliania huxleyi CCMP1516]|uniref:Uncharacterized protein n=2 Tax=Emiliania huxleyi TaxID=2903 RepID=A0A0D3KUY2_EMIH1
MGAAAPPPICCPPPSAACCARSSARRPCTTPRACSATCCAARRRPRSRPPSATSSASPWRGCGARPSSGSASPSSPSSRRPCSRSARKRRSAGSPLTRPRGFPDEVGPSSTEATPSPRCRWCSARGSMPSRTPHSRRRGGSCSSCRSWCARSSCWRASSPVLLPPARKGERRGWRRRLGAHWAATASARATRATPSTLERSRRLLCGRLRHSLARASSSSSAHNCRAPMSGGRRILDTASRCARCRAASGGASGAFTLLMGSARVPPLPLWSSR